LLIEDFRLTIADIEKSKIVTREFCSNRRSNLQSKINQSANSSITLAIITKKRITSRWFKN